MAKNSAIGKTERHLSREDSENSTNEQAERMLSNNTVPETRVDIPDAQMAAAMAQSTDSMYSVRKGTKRWYCGDYVKVTIMSGLTTAVMLFVLGMVYNYTHLFRGEQPLIGVTNDPKAAVSSMQSQPEIPAENIWTNRTVRDEYTPYSTIYTIDYAEYTVSQKIRWKPSSSPARLFKRNDEANVADGCVRIRRTGGYFLFLRMTFMYDQNTRDNLYMNIMLKREANDPDMISKNTLTLPEQRRHGYQPIYIADFQQLREGDTLCVNVNPMNALYSSEKDTSFMLLPLGA